MRKNKNFYESLLNALNGIKYAILSERNIKFHLFFSFMVLLFSYIFKLSYIEFSIVLILVFLVIVFEILNTVIENISDYLNTEYDMRIKIIKDMSAGVVLLISILAFTIGMIIFIPKVF